MSLINDALKKAQRQRASQPPVLADGQAADPGGSPVASRRKPMSAQLLLVLVAGAAVLVVFSVIITVYLLNRDTTPTRLAAAVNPKTIAASPSPAAATSGPTPIVIAPILLPTTPATESPAPVVTPADNSKPSSPGAAVAVVAPGPSLPPPSPSAAVPPVTRPAAAATSASAATSLPAPAQPGGPDARIQIFVDGLRVMGIRSSGTDSKVLMNDRVYRVNDIVERNFNLKLVKVEPDQLTFVDPHGNTYTKNF